MHLFFFFYNIGIGKYLYKSKYFIKLNNKTQGIPDLVKKDMGPFIFYTYILIN